MSLTTPTGLPDPGEIDSGPIGPGQVDPSMPMDAAPVPADTTNDPVAAQAIESPDVAKPADWRVMLGRLFRELGYFWAILFVTCFAFAYSIALVSIGAGFAVTVVGLIVPGAMVVGTRGFGAIYRSLGSSLLGVDIPAPVPWSRGRSFWHTFGRMWGDSAGWRAQLFGLIAWPVSMLAAILSTTFLAVGAGGLTYSFWRRWLPAQQASDGSWHRGSQLWNDYFMDTPARMWLMVLVGAVFLVIWWYSTRAFGHLFRGLSHALLGPTEGSLRVAQLERTRSAMVQDSDARLRRIERDLHDGTQARLVAVAMQVGDVRDRLSTDADVDPEAATLLDEAHDALKATLTELREIARGIHPPALDDGLAVALTTLAARCPLPVSVHTDLSREPGPEIATIAYYAAAELLTNVARHASASRAALEISGTRRRLTLRVRDDGRGGAALGIPGASGGSGLAGLAGRVEAVDGDLLIDSPAGGPTVITVDLPMSVR